MPLAKIIENCVQCEGLGKVRKGTEQVLCNLCKGAKTTERDPTLEERVRFLEERVGGSNESLNLSRWK